MAKTVTQKNIKGLGKTWLEYQNCSIGCLLSSTLIELFQVISGQENLHRLSIIRGKCTLKGVPTSCDIYWENMHAASKTALEYLKKHFKEDVTFEYDSTTSHIQCSDLNKLAEWTINDCLKWGYKSQFEPF